MSAIVNPGASGGGGGGTMNIAEDGSVVVSNATELNFLEPDAFLVSDAGGGVADVNMALYFLLDGRPNGAALISTLTRGMLTGSSTGQGGLGLAASPATTTSAVDYIALSPQITIVAGTAASPPKPILMMTQDLLFTLPAGDITAFSLKLTGQDTIFGSRATWTIGGDITGSMIFVGDGVLPQITNIPGEDRNLTGFFLHNLVHPVFIANNGNCSVGGSGTNSGLRGFGAAGEYNTVGTGTMVADQMSYLSSARSQSGASGTVLLNLFGFFHCPTYANGLDGGPGVGHFDVAFAQGIDPDVGNTDLSALGPFLGVYIMDTPRKNFFAGQTQVGDSANAPTSPNTGLSVIGLDNTNRAGVPYFLKVSTLSTTDRDSAASPEDGMILLNTSTGKFQGRTGGSWVDLN